MNIYLVYTLNLVLVLNCIIIVAKNETESGNKAETKLNEKIFAEGVSQHDNDNDIDEKKPRIIGRKGVDNIIANDTSISQNNINDNTAHNNIISSTSEPSAVHKNESSSANKTVSTFIISTLKPKINEKTTQNAIKTSSNASTTTTTTSSTTSTTTTTTTTKATTTTTKKPIKKPEITYSADDNEEIIESEKNINYNIANEKTMEIPKVDFDVDRSILDEKHASSSYMIYLGLVFALPLSFVLINIAYKRIKNYLELRHYQRVDFLVDGMYVS